MTVLAAFRQRMGNRTSRELKIELVKGLYERALEEQYRIWDEHMDRLWVESTEQYIERREREHS